MQIVIEISEEQYNALCMRGVIVLESQLPSFLKALRRGIPLPKGHGKLIDVNDLLDRVELEDTDENREDNAGSIITLEDIDFIPTIIPTEMENE